MVEAVLGFNERFVRSVSWTPGAEGAEGLSATFWFGCEAAGTMRRDWLYNVSLAEAGDAAG